MEMDENHKIISSGFPRAGMIPDDRDGSTNIIGICWLRPPGIGFLEFWENETGNINKSLWVYMTNSS
jgi:hypothetical protein